MVYFKVFFVDFGMIFIIVCWVKLLLFNLYLKLILFSDNGGYLNG